MSQGFETSGFKATRTATLEALADNNGFVLIEGAPGCGKSRLKSQLESRLQQHYTLVSLPYSRLSYEELLSTLAEMLSVRYREGDSQSCFNALKQFSGQQLRQGRPLALLIDDGQSVPPETLTALASIVGAEGSDRLSLRGVLFSSPGLHQQLLLAHVDQQLLSRHLVMAPASEEEMKSFITGATEQESSGSISISNEALQVLVQDAAGSFRAAKQIVSMAVMEASINGQSRIGADILDQIRDDNCFAGAESVTATSSEDSEAPSPNAAALEKFHSDLEGLLVAPLTSSSEIPVLKKHSERLDQPLFVNDLAAASISTTEALQPAPESTNSETPAPTAGESTGSGTTAVAEAGTDQPDLPADDKSHQPPVRSERESEPEKELATESDAETEQAEISSAVVPEEVPPGQHSRAPESPAIPELDVVPVDTGMHTLPTRDKPRSGRRSSLLVVMITLLMLMLVPGYLYLARDPGFQQDPAGQLQQRVDQLIRRLQTEFDQLTGSADPLAGSPATASISAAPELQTVPALARPTPAAEHDPEPVPDPTPSAEPDMTRKQNDAGSEMLNAAASALATADEQNTAAPDQDATGVAATWSVPVTTQALSPEPAAPALPPETAEPPQTEAPASHKVTENRLTEAEAMAGSDGEPPTSAFSEHEAATEVDDNARALMTELSATINPTDQPLAVLSEQPELEQAFADPALTAAREARDAQIRLLLKKAEIHSKAYRFTIPENNNAVLTYRQVLELMPDNPIARDNLAEIEHRYRQRARDAIRQQNWAIAAQNFSRLLWMNPDDREARNGVNQLTRMLDR